jgi:alkylhydroperoxidase family enzyme
MARYDFVDVDAETARHITGMGGRILNLYRVLGHQPEMLKAWIDFAYRLRLACTTPRTLRELMILRTAQLASSSYEWHQHRIMAKEAGVPEHKVAELAMWRASSAFDARERAALALTEDMVAGRLADETHAAAAAVFSPAEMIELVLTAGYYCMVPRVLDAIAVTPDGESAGSGG